MGGRTTLGEVAVAPPLSLLHLRDQAPQWMFVRHDPFLCTIALAPRAFREGNGAMTECLGTGGRFGLG
ncbi:hypothetical protein GCM10027079_03040 [Sediminivirga luteola]|uniref:Uncharacterized protein n=1 Tax=Sediminivirga luteola TaxID=1774748 RepID=A0A8J2TWZ2_9MICO|nr:hypothetical protein GCM10011333_11610 [Sediminivirga luteola]